MRELAVLTYGADPEHIDATLRAALLDCHDDPRAAVRNVADRRPELDQPLPSHEGILLRTLLRFMTLLSRSASLLAVPWAG